MSVFLPSDVLNQFATNVELVANASAASGAFTRSSYRFKLDGEPDSAPDGVYFLDMQSVDPHLRRWGDGSQITDSAVTVQLLYGRPGGTLGGGDRQSVLRNAADDCSKLADVCENPSNYGSSTSGIRIVTFKGARRVADLRLGEIWEASFFCQWQSDMDTTTVVDLTAARIIVDGVSSGSTQLIALSTNSYATGTSAFSVAEWSEYILDKTSVVTPDGVNYIAAIGGGNWRLRSGSTAATVTLSDSANRYTSTTVEGALAEIGLDHALDWWQQRRIIAENRLNTSVDGSGNALVEVTKATAWDYSVTPPVVSGATADSTKDGVVYAFTNGGAETLQDLPVSGQNFFANPKTTSWYASRLCSMDAQSAGGYCLPFCLDGSGPAGGTNHYIEIGFLSSDSTPTHFRLFMRGGTGTTALDIDLGAACALGSALVPVGPPFWIAVFHDHIAGQLVIEFNDVEILRLSASTLGSTNLDSMPTSPLALDVQSSDSSVGLRVFGGFGMIAMAT